MDFNENVIIGTNDASRPIEQLLDRFGHRWPEMEVSIDPSDGEFFQWNKVDFRSPKHSADIFIAPTKEMNEHWDDVGYFVDEDGIGPFMVLYEPFRFGETPALFLKPFTSRTYKTDFDVRASHRSDSQFVPPEINLCGAGMALITLVTPEEGDMLRDRLHRSLREVMESISGLGGDIAESKA